MTEHLDRTLAAMERDGVDALLLGRAANVRYVSEAQALWLAGTRPWAPVCAVVRATAAVHLLSTSDAGVPASIPVANLFPLSWNPANLMATLAGIVGGSARVGVDGMTPMFEGMLAGALPTAELVDAAPLLHEVRRVKSAADLDAIRAAASVCRIAMAATIDAVAPDTSDEHLQGRFLGAMCLLGVTTPAFDPRVRRLDAHGLVRIDAGVMRDGWEASVGRTVSVETHEPTASWASRRDAVLATVKPGVRVGDVRGAGVRCDALGLGLEPLDEAEVLEPHMVLELDLTDDGGAGGRDTVLVTDDGAEVLTD